MTCAFPKSSEVDESSEGEEEKEKDASGPDYNYLLNMPMWYLTKEKKEELCKQRDAKVWPDVQFFIMIHSCSQAEFLNPNL